MNWQPIETAPYTTEGDDGPNRLLLTDGNCVYIGYGHLDGWSKRLKWFNENGIYCNPTHWMPLPEPPEADNDT